jgi:hypothetical protein
MAVDKKKIVVYADWIDNFEELTDLELGILMRHFFQYVNDMNPVLEDRLLKVAWKPIQATLKRDLSKWNDNSQERTDKARKAGIASAKARELKATKSNSVVEFKLKPTKSTVSDSVSDSDNISFIDKMDLFKKKVGEDDNVIWRENVYRMHKIQKGKLFRVVEQFTIHLAIQNNGVYNDNFSEFRRHCSNWIGTSIQNGKLSEFRTVKAIGSI